MKYSELEKKILYGDRLCEADALTLYEYAPLDWLSHLSSHNRKARFGEDVYFNRNIHFEPTNRCVYSCRFCSFYRSPKSKENAGAWDYGLTELEQNLDAHPEGSITEIHITGGVHPERGTEYGEELCSFVKKKRPELHIKAFTAVEVSFFARRSGIEIVQCLERLQEAGLDSLPGGGAEIFDPEVRRKIAGGKAPAHTWLDLHRQAHKLGLRSNATMLYGHVETRQHRILHLSELRKLQDETGGFLSFIPLRYRNENNALSGIPEVSPEEDLRTYAVSRLFLDNIPHLKAYWVMAGMDRALNALDYGVDDLDGTIDDSTKIYSMAGGEKNPAMNSVELGRLIGERGRVAVERDSLYRKI